MGQDGTRSYLSIIMASMVKIIFYYLWMNIHLHFAYMLIYSQIAKVAIWEFVTYYKVYICWSSLYF